MRCSIPLFWFSQLNKHDDVQWRTHPCAHSISTEMWRQSWNSGSCCVNSLLGTEGNVLFPLHISFCFNYTGEYSLDLIKPLKCFDCVLHLLPKVQEETQGEVCWEEGLQGDHLETKQPTYGTVQDCDVTHNTASPTATGRQPAKELLFAPSNVSNQLSPF